MKKSRFAYFKQKSYYVIKLGQVGQMCWISYFGNLTWYDVLFHLLEKRYDCHFWWNAQTVVKMISITEVLYWNNIFIFKTLSHWRKFWRYLDLLISNLKPIMSVKLKQVGQMCWITHFGNLTWYDVLFPLLKRMYDCHFLMKCTNSGEKDIDN